MKQTPAIKQLVALAVEVNRKKYPSMPPQYLPRPKYSDTTANGLTKCIIDFLRFHNWQAERINCTGRLIDNRTAYTDVLGNTRTIGSIKWIRGTGRNGTSDISATIKGRSVKIEVKIGTDQQSDVQKLYQNEIEQAGGLYFIAKNFDTFVSWYNKTFCT